MAQDVSKPRKLGRGLSSLLGQAVKVEPAAVPASAAAEARGGAEMGGGGAAAVQVPATQPGTPMEVGGLPVGSAGERIVHLDLERIRVSGWQVRRVFSEAALTGLAESIRKSGVMQPVLVRAVGDGARSWPRMVNELSDDLVSDRVRRAAHGAPTITTHAAYELVAGERRWRAAALAGLKRIPAVVVTLSDQEAAEWGLIENVQREDLGVMERAHGYRLLCDTFALTHEQAAERMGVERSSLTNLVRLTELEGGVQELLEEGRLSLGHAKVLLTMGAGPRRAEYGARCASEGWSVRRLETEVRTYMSGARVSVLPSAELDAQVRSGGSGGGGEALLRKEALRRNAAELEKSLGEKIGTRVRIKMVGKSGTRGRITLEFYSLEQFEKLVGKMG
jgi:ParB family chromosome partitioning protein